jgi:hypothetical protein
MILRAIDAIFHGSRSPGLGVPLFHIDGVIDGSERFSKDCAW